MQKSKRHTIGIDLGGTKLLVALFDERYRLLAEVKEKTRPEKGEKYFLSMVRDSINTVLQEADVERSDVLGMGIGSPGIIDENRGLVIACPNIAFLTNYALGPKLSRLSGFPVVLGNDVKTGLYGEHQFGAAKGYSDVIGIFLGTGIGGALILNGQLYKGVSGAAGELGHMIVDPLGPFCGCGQRGCFEALAGRLAIAAEAAGLAAKQKAPYLAKEAGTDISKIKSSVLARSIAHRDRAIENLLKAKGQILGTVMANLVNLLNPSLIVLGGGVIEAVGHILVKEAETTMRAKAMLPLSKKVKVVPAKLKDYSIVMGAAKRAADKFGSVK